MRRLFHSNEFRPPYQSYQSSDLIIPRVSVALLVDGVEPSAFFLFSHRDPGPDWSPNTEMVHLHLRWK